MPSSPDLASSRYSARTSATSHASPRCSTRICPTTRPRLRRTPLCRRRAPSRPRGAPPRRMHLAVCPQGAPSHHNGSSSTLANGQTSSSAPGSLACVIASHAPRPCRCWCRIRRCRISSIFLRSGVPGVHRAEVFCIRYLLRRYSACLLPHLYIVSSLLFFLSEVL